MSCPSCEMLSINGLPCHETGCPDSHIGTVRECDWCGSLFEPEHKRHCCCDEPCCAAFYGLDCEACD
jgi:hypothetical protein